MNILIVDNEKKIVEGLELLLQTYFPQGIDEIESAGSVKGAIELLQNGKTDILFLDIELSDGSGMDVLKQIKHPDFKVIFITAYDKYAIEAFKYSAVDFLLKPIDPDDLITAVQRAQKEIKKEHNRISMETLLTNVNEISWQNKKLIISDKDHVHAIYIKDILYLEADGAYTKLYTTDGKMIISSKNLKTYEELLQNTGFFRTHHSFLANLAHMVRFNKTEGVLVLFGDKHVSVSFRKKEALLEHVKHISFL